jgi:hypothetical protein
MAPGSKNDDKVSDDLDETLQINPEVLRGVPPLPGLEIVIQPASTWSRWAEGLMIHLVGTGIVAAFAFIAGLMFAGQH